LLLGPNNAHELRRAFTLALREARELRRRHPHRLPSVLRDPVAQIRPGEYAPDVLRKLINHCGRSAGRDPYSIPNREVESGTLLHAEISGVLADIASKRRIAIGLADDDARHHAARRAQDLQEYWRTFDRNHISPF
jgi:hypothetical protein